MSRPVGRTCTTTANSENQNALPHRRRDLESLTSGLRPQPEWVLAGRSRRGDGPRITTPARPTRPRRTAVSLKRKTRGAGASRLAVCLGTETVESGFRRKRRGVATGPGLCPERRRATRRIWPGRISPKTARRWWRAGACVRDHWEDMSRGRAPVVRRRDLPRSRALQRQHRLRRFRTGLFHGTPTA